MEANCRGGAFNNFEIINSFTIVLFLSKDIDYYYPLIYNYID